MALHDESQIHSVLSQGPNKNCKAAHAVRAIPARDRNKNLNQKQKKKATGVHTGPPLPSPTHPLSLHIPHNPLPPSQTLGRIAPTAARRHAITIKLPKIFSNCLLPPDQTACHNYARESWILEQKVHLPPVRAVSAGGPNENIYFRYSFAIYHSYCESKADVKEVRVPKVHV